MENEQFGRYWSSVKRLAFSVALICFAVLSSGLTFSHSLDEFRLFGFPLGVLITGLFVVIFSIGLVFWFSGCQAEVDAHFAADEDL